MCNGAIPNALPQIILITGNRAAGKSTVAPAVAERLPRNVHLRGDVFRRMIIGGQAEMSFDLSEEAKRQLDLRYRIAASAARLYLEAGFTVVYQDILIGPALAEVAASFADIPLSLFVLCPRRRPLQNRLPDWRRRPRHRPRPARRNAAPRPLARHFGLDGTGDGKGNMGFY